MSESVYIERKLVNNNDQVEEEFSDVMFLNTIHIEIKGFLTYISLFIFLAIANNVLL